MKHYHHAPTAVKDLLLNRKSRLSSPSKSKFIQLTCTLLMGIGGSLQAASNYPVLPAPAPSYVGDDSLFLAAPCYVAGDPLLGGAAAPVDAFVGFAYGANGIAGTNTPVKFALPASAVGTVWGVAYKRESKSLYTAAMLKRHCGLGPAGMSGLYRVNVSTLGTPVVTAYDLNTLFGINAGANPRTGTFPAANALPANGANFSHDVDAFALVGKRGFGGIALSADERTLYLVNLDKRQIERLSLDASGAPTAALTPISIPNPGCPDGDYRPWALKEHMGKLLVGTVCSAETGQVRGNLAAYVQVYDQSSWTVVKTFSLGYTKGRTIDNVGDQNWYPWTTTWPTTPLVDGFATIYPQPILSDIEVDNDGSLVLSFIDRMGHQGGYSNYKPDASNTTDQPNTVGGGEILRLSANTNTNSYDLESNGLGFGSSGTKLGQGNGQGPGGGEYYWADHSLGYVATDVGAGYHKENSSGGLAFVPGRNEVVLTALDPFDEIDSGGVIHLNNVTGGRNLYGGRVGYRLFKGGTPYSGKATGIGDVKAFGQPGLELGDFVWNDVNGDGIQNANEPAIGGVSVCLLDSNGTQVQAHPKLLNSVSASITGALAQVWTSDLLQIPAGATSATLTYNYTQVDSGTQNADFRLETSTDGGTTWDTTTPLKDYPTGNLAGTETFTQPTMGLNVNRVRLRRVGGTSADTFSITALTFTATLPACATTDAAGRYAIALAAGDFIPGGSYKLHVDTASGPVQGMSATSANIGADDGLDSDASQNDSTAVIPLTVPTAGTSDLSFDFGFRQKVAVGNLVFRDQNGDGKYQPSQGDVGIAGVKVQLFASAGVEVNVGPDGIYGTADDASGGMTTDASGGYYFQDLVPGNYYVKIPASEFIPGRPLAGLLSSVGAGNNDTTDDTGDENGIDDNAPSTNGIVSNTFNLSAGVEAVNEAGFATPQAVDANANTTIDFGFRCPDLLGNGSFEQGSTFAANVSRLGGTNNAMVVTSTSGIPVTGIKGNYSVVSANDGAWWVQSPKAHDGQHYLEVRGVDNCLRVSEPAVFGVNTQWQNNVNYQICLWAANTEATPSVLRFEFYDTNGGDYLETYFTLPAKSTAWDESSGNSEPIPWQQLCARINLPSNFQPTTTGFFITCNNFDSTVPGFVVDSLSICPEPTQTVGLGNLVFLDTNQNGKADVGEELNNVAVQLFRLNGEIYDYVADEITASGGRYTFLGLDPGTYQVRIPASQFAPGGVLEGALSIADGSEGDDDVGENGVDSESPATAGIFSNDVVLSIGGSPTTALGEIGIGSTIDDSADADVNLTIDFGFSCPPIVIAKATVPDGMVNTVYPGVTFTSTGGVGTLTWSVSSGELPAGLVLSASTGAVSGTPTAAGNFDYVIKVTDSRNCSASVFVSTLILEERAAISGSIYYDDGVSNVPINVVTLTLCDANGVPVDNPNIVGSQDYVLTTINGTYAFTGLAPGSYIVKETQPAGFLTLTDVDSITDQAGSPADAANSTGTDNQIPVTVAAGETDSGNDFVEQLPASISGTVRRDVDKDGVGDFAMSGVSLTLCDTQGAAVDNPNEAGTQDYVVQTNGTGGYSFTGLAPGNYLVKETQPSGYESVKDGDSTNPTDDSTNLSTTDDSIPVALVAGESDDGNDFVEKLTLGTICGRLTVDTDGDNAGDVGYENDTISVVRTSDFSVFAATTDNGGNYCVTDLPAGDYRIIAHEPDNYNFVADADGGSLGIISGITLALGQTVLNQDFVIAARGSISGSVRVSTGPDSSSPISGVILTLCDGVGNEIDGNSYLTGVQPYTVQTDLAGNYKFVSLIPGVYRVKETQPSGYYSLSDVDDGDPDVIGNDQPITVNALQDTSSQNFLEATGGKIQGVVLADTNGDEEGDLPLADVRLTLCNLFTQIPIPNPNSIEGLPYEVFTDELGRYEFVGLAPGNYVVKETQPAHFGDVAQFDATLDGESPIDYPMETANMIEVNLAAGETDDGNTFVERHLLGVGNLVFRDLNGDGIFNGEDSGIDGVTVLLYHNEDDISIAEPVSVDVTHDGGCYLLETPTAGSFRVVVAASNFRIEQPLWGYNNSLGYDLGTTTDDNEGENGIDSLTTQIDGIKSGIISLNFSQQPTEEAGKNGSSQGAFDAEMNLTVDFGFVTPLHNLKGTVVLDRDASSNFSESDTPIPAVRIALFVDCGVIGQLDESDLFLAQQNSSETGSYCFTNLPNGNYLVFEYQPQNALSVKDTGGVNDNLIPVSVAGADSTQNDFLEAIDPQGYIYLSDTGKLITGGTITVAGPDGSHIEYLLDGSTGEYAWIETNGIPGIYTMTYTPPAGYSLDPTRPAQIIDLDPTGHAPPYAVGSGISGVPPCVTDHSAAANPWYYTFDLAPGDPLIVFNNVPLVYSKANSWPVWQGFNPLGGQNGPTDNPDGDIYDNLQEFAFCKDPSSGINTSCPLEVVQNGNQIDAKVTTVSGITGLTYTLEYISDLALSSANGGGWTPDNTILPTEQPHPDGTVTLTYANLESLPGLGNGKGFVRVKVDLASPAVTTRTYAAGWSRRTFTQSCETCSYPFLACEVFSGKVDGNGTTELSVANAVGSGDISAAMVPGKKYYVEVISGAWEGHRWNVVAGSTSTSIAIGDGTKALTAGALAGSSVVVREVSTIGAVFPPSLLHAGFTPNDSDRILMYDPNIPAKWKVYYLTDMTAGGLGIHWVVQGDNTLADQDGVTLDACQGVYIHHRAAAVSEIWVGHVRQNAIACPLSAGQNLVGGGYPMNQSFAGRAMNWTGSNFNGFAGNVEPVRADNVLFWKGDTTVGVENYYTYWLVDAGFNPYRRWSIQGDNALNSQDVNRLFKLGRASFYKSLTGNASYVMPTGWIP